MTRRSFFSALFSLPLVVKGALCEPAKPEWTYKMKYTMAEHLLDRCPLLDEIWWCRHKNAYFRVKWVEKAYMLVGMRQCDIRGNPMIDAMEFEASWEFLNDLCTLIWTPTRPFRLHPSVSRSYRAAPTKEV